jgi:hypothetical protein
MTVHSAYVALNTQKSDLETTYQAMYREYGYMLENAALKVRIEYDKAVRGFYANTRANLEVQTRKLFDYEYEGDELLNQIKSYVSTYTNSYNPDIEWQFFLYKSPRAYPVWCLNCLLFSDEISEQNVVLFYYNTTQIMKVDYDK